MGNLSAVGLSGGRKKGRHGLLEQIKKNRCIYLFMAVSLGWYLLFCYGPMYGLLLAFKDFNASKGILMSPFVGLKHYRELFQNAEFFEAFFNTLVISFSRLLVEFPAPIILATIYTFPYFLSWVVVGSIVLNMLGSDGVVNNLLNMTGIGSQKFLADKSLFRPLLYITSIWKSAGWTSIIYLASMSAVSPELYEAATIDGANRLQRIRYVTLPCIRPTIVVMLLMAVGNTMKPGNYNIYKMYNPAVRSVSEILDTYIYRITFQTSGDFGFSTAVGLFKSVINFILLFAFDRLAKRMGEEGLF